MSGIKRGSPSGFAAAAKVLFESAQKTGAVKPFQNNTKLYAHQLKKIQNQNRKRGGSLGSVSYKVAEFLAMQRQPSAITPLRNATSIATKVPLLNIPIADGKQDAVKVEDTAQLLDKIVETKALVTDDAAPSLSSEVAKSKIEEKAASSPGSFFPEVLITEDKPAFELRSLQASPAQSIFSVATGPEKSVHRPTHPLPTVSVPLAPQLSVPKVDNANEKSVEANSFSVDQWERQRGQELERLKLKQTEAEESRLAVLREEEHRTLGLEWVKQRSKTFLNADLTFTETSLCNIEKAHSPKEALVHLQVLVDAGSRAANVVGPAAVRIALQISRLRAPRLELERELSELVDKGKLSAEFKAKISLLLCMDPEKFIETYRGLPAAVQSSLDKLLVNKAVRFFASSGHWEEAISMIDDYSTRGTDRDGSLGVILANSCARAEKGVREAVSNHLNRSLAASGRLGKSIRLALTRLETGHQRRNLLTQLAASPDADESVYAELIKHSDTNSIPNILNDVETRGLYKEDPLILDALAFRSISHEDPMACFHEIERQAQSSGVRVGHVNTALIAARAYPSPDTLRAAIAVVKRLPHYSSRRVMNILAPRLFAEGMHAEVGELVDVISPFIDISAEVPECIGFVNDSLRALDRSPFSEATAKNTKAVLPVTSQGDLKIGKGVPRDLSALTDRMLLYAKDKQWQAALEVVTSLNMTQERDCNMPALTLLFNCALSAAVDSPELVLSILDLMKEGQVTLNSTTVNTVLSSLSKSQSSWEAALPFFEETAVSSRDNNTYLVMLSLLGRHGRWDAAAAVFDELRKTESKPPTSVFSILIGATAHHSWSYTLRVFQDMLKIHRSGVKDTVATQVIRCLEQNGRTMELKSLEKELAKKSKKKN